MGLPREVYGLGCATGYIYMYLVNEVMVDYDTVIAILRTQTV